jgi:hypothetical protein
VKAESTRGLLDIETFLVPRRVLEETIEFLREIGLAGYEGFTLWGGKRLEPSIFRFESAVFPEQRASRTERGLLVFVDGAALFEANRALFERGETLAAQVHTHPGDAYHSDVDDRYPLVTLLGAISLVLPNFAKRAPRDMDNWAWYRLARYGEWRPLDASTKVVIE